MWHEKSKNLIAESVPSPRKRSLTPNATAVAAVEQLATRIPIRNALFDRFGRLRTLSADYSVGLFSAPMTGTPAKQAQLFLDTDEVKSALSLADVRLGRPSSVTVPNMGKRISFPQEVQSPTKITYRVREASVDVYMDDDGKVYEVNSTLKHAVPKFDLLNKIVSEDAAIAAAQADLGKLQYETVETPELLFSEHDGYLTPVYQITIQANNPRKAVLVLVTASDGKVVHKRNLLKAADGRRTPRKNALPKLPPMPKALPARNRKRKPRTSISDPLKAKVFLRIPSPDVPVAKQLYEVVLERLPDPRVLQNDNLVMLTGSRGTPVKAMSDGTYNYAVNSPEFCAVVTFFAMDAQIEYMKSRGMKAFPKAIPVYVEDRSVQDNAYFDPTAYEIHLGIGSGLRAGGLNRYICYDYGVSWHENGHNVVFVQTPGNDLPGNEGGGIHEAVGDACDLLIDWIFRLKHATQLGEKFDAAAVEKDARIIGVYAAPPDGIRIQKNNKKTPGDKTGEPHDDGLIVGGAMADLLVAIIKRDEVQTGCDTFTTLLLGALAIVPAHKVTFRDLLNAFLTADNKLNKDANKDLITKCFGDHGIKLATARRRKGGIVPVIIISDAA